jgi:hypothetical protein
MIPYILQATVILTVCFLFYKLFLQKATFYGLNRWTLLSCLILSFVLPLLPAPRGWSLNSVTVAPPVASTPTSSKGAAVFALSIDPLPPVTAAALPAGHLTNLHRGGIHKKSMTTPKPAVEALKAGDGALLPPAREILPAAQPTTHPFSALLLRGLQLLFYAYCLGLLVFGTKFVLQIFLLCYRCCTRSVIRDGRYRIIETGGDRGPCTFGNTIFINPSLYDPTTYQQILVHEKIHVSGGHTLDILLAELAVVFQWFNPFAWLYRREVENNLEFLTDRSVLEHPHIERLAYQLSLLRVSAPHLPFSITNNYNHSRLKRRIVMMNSQHSGRHMIWKYVALLPIFVLLVCFLNKPAALAQSSQAGADQQQATAAKPQAASTMPDTAIRPAKAAARVATNATTTGGAALNFTGTISAGNLTDDASNISVHPTIADVDRTVTSISGTITSSTGIVTTINGSFTMPLNTASADPEVTTTATASASATAHSLAISSPDTSLPHLSDNMDLRQGSWFLTVDSDNMEFILRAQEGENSWQSSFTVKKSEVNPFPGQGTVEFKLVREAGTMNFKGQFDGEEGFGHFHFDPDQAYFDALQKMGVENVYEGRRHSFFQLNVKRDFVAMLQRNGYTPIEQRDVITLAARKVDEPFLKYWKNSGIEGADEVRNLFMLKSLHIDPDYVEDLKKAGYTQLNVRQLISLKTQRIDGNYIRTMNSGVDSPIPPEELVSYKAMHIDSAWLASLRKVGYDHLDRSEVRALYSAHVTADFIKGFQDAGFSNIPPRTIVMLKLQNVSPDLAKSFRNLGYSDVDLNRLSYLQRAGITADFINGFHKIGFDNIPVNLLYTLKSAGVDADYVTKMKEKGFNSTDLNKYVRLKRDFN